MSNYDIIHENQVNMQVEMVELSDEAMEAVAGGGVTIVAPSDFDDLNVVNFEEFAPKGDVDLDIDFG